MKRPHLMALASLAIVVGAGCGAADNGGVIEVPTTAPSTVPADGPPATSS